MDLLCWITKASAIMARLQGTLLGAGYSIEALPADAKLSSGADQPDWAPAGQSVQHPEGSKSTHDYRQQARLLQETIAKLHWSEQDHAYADVGMFNRYGMARF